MNKKYPVPAKETEVEMLVSNSHFIAAISPAFSVGDARAFIKLQKVKYPDANHHVSAYLIGHGASTVAHCSDDGEPSGTAGRPALAVLQGSGLGDAVVVVTRYFGGTKLGTGGLVRAYGDAVREVLKAVPLAFKFATITAAMIVPYPLFEQVMLVIEKDKGKILSKEFAAEVSLTVQFKEEDYPSFESALTGLSQGRVVPEIIARDPEAIFPKD